MQSTSEEKRHATIEKAIEIGVEYTDKRARLSTRSLLVGPDVAEDYHIISTRRASRQKLILTTRLGGQTVERVVALAHCPNLAAESERGGSGKRPSVNVDVGDSDLDRGVVLGGDETV